MIWPPPGVIGDLDALEEAAVHMKVLAGRRDHVPET
jgi:hypothetical protein